MPTRFQTLLQNASEKTGQECVILVDEYDKALFAFFTGITKFRNVSIFSDLNNLFDISLSERFSGICGITPDELEEYFTPTIDEIVAKKHITHDEVVGQLKAMYDGYHFAKDLADVYNPFSLVCAMDNQDIGSYWIGQTTPSYLINKLKGGNDPTQLLFQSGYLTIKSYDDEEETFTLVHPNKEVRAGFTKWLVPVYLDISPDGIKTNLLDIRNALRTCDMDALWMHCAITSLPSMPACPITRAKSRLSRSPSAMCAMWRI